MVVLQVAVASGTFHKSTCALVLQLHPFVVNDLIGHGILNYLIRAMTKNISEIVSRTHVILGEVIGQHLLRVDPTRNNPVRLNVIPQGLYVDQVYALKEPFRGDVANRTSSDNQ